MRRAAWLVAGLIAVLACGEAFVKTGVLSLYRWLQDYESNRSFGNGQNGLGSIYSRQWQHFKRLFDARNASLLGHGLRPIEASEWQSLQARVTNLVSEMLQALKIQAGAAPCQLPGLKLLNHPMISLLQANS